MNKWGLLTFPVGGKYISFRASKKVHLMPFQKRCWADLCQSRIISTFLYIFATLAALECLKRQFSSYKCMEEELSVSAVIYLKVTEK